jgi:hypothetical protein
MNRIQHIVEPHHVWVVWQSNSPNHARSRRIIGEIRQLDNSGDIVFRYLEGTDDYIQAKEEGFTGYPAFKINTVEHTQGILDAFMRRLPPRNREDFNEYLARHRLPDNFKFSDLALLAYTGGKLPSDGFEFCADLDNARPPFELIIEVAGFRHQSEVKSSDLSLNGKIEFLTEPSNDFDSNAIAIIYKSIRIGYVGRAHTRALHHWLVAGYTIDATIERINGKPERPLIYLFVSVH